MSPILIFVYNRPFHTLETLKALKLNIGADKANVIIYSDGPKSEKDYTLVNDVRNICRNVSGFGSLTLIERPQNIGLANNIISAVSYEIRKYGTVIVLEDDLITSVGFIKFMNDALEFYKNSEIFSICGYSPKISIPDSYIHSTYLTPRIGSWGWASWEEKWKQVDWDVKDFDVFINDSNARNTFNKGGNDLTTMLLRQKLNQIDSWAIRFTYSCFRSGNMVVYPMKSLVKNIGVDGTGTHMKKSLKYDSPIINTIDEKLFCPLNVVNTDILEQFGLSNSTSILRKVINYFKLKAYIFRLDLKSHFVI